jgi:glutathione synthase/RimK-type ligase-like ATP-grasp enzyme
VLYRQKNDVFIRNYGDIAYLINQSDFRDNVTDASGAVFVKALSRRAKSLEDIAVEVAKSFVGVDIAEIKKDAGDFFSVLENDGFLVSGENETELDKKDKRFSYSMLSGNETKNV